MTVTLQLILEIPVADRLGEGISWDARSGEFIWTDILGRRLHRYRLASRTLTSLSLDACLCSFALTSDPEVLLAAFERTIGWLEKSTGRFSELATIDLPQGARLNDGRAGPDGCFWVGSMISDQGQGGPRTSGKLYRVKADGEFVPFLDGLAISNGLAWSADGSTLYHSDSQRARIRSFAFSPVTGTIGAVRAEAGLDCGAPDGAAVDGSGRYLSALWGQGSIAIFSPGLVLEGLIGVPASQPTCLAFGGDDLSVIAVTSAREGLPADALRQAPGAGSVFLYKAPFAGVPLSHFKGRPPDFRSTGPEV